jgi:hypothetical protein
MPRLAASWALRPGRTWASDSASELAAFLSHPLVNWGLVVASRIHASA